MFGSRQRAGAHVGVALAHLLEQREHHGDGGLGDAEAVGLGRRMAHQDPEVGRRLDVHVVHADRVFRDDAQPLRGFHDAAADRCVADRGAHQCHGVARGGNERVLVLAARLLPGRVAEGKLVAGLFEQVQGFSRFLAAGIDQHLGLRHGLFLAYFAENASNTLPAIPSRARSRSS